MFVAVPFASWCGISGGVYHVFHVLTVVLSHTVLPPYNTVVGKHVYLTAV